jgi:hypothetical protein
LEGQKNNKINMAYCVIVYPEISTNDYDLIQDYRKKNDNYYKVVEPHYSIVYPVFNKSEEEFLKEVESKSQQQEKFEFTIRCAVINKDSFSDFYHLLLVPDEGFGKITKLHDKLYSGLLKDNHRLDLTFLPHIGIANSLDKFECKKMVDEWNEKEFSISGKVTCLSVVKFENDRVTSIREIELK